MIVGFFWYESQFTTTITTTETKEVDVKSEGIYKMWQNQS